MRVYYVRIQSTHERGTVAVGDQQSGNRTPVNRYCHAKFSFGEKGVPAEGT
jgi:hypothetical protein